jgi:hypothetical protein
MIAQVIRTSYPFSFLLNDISPSCVYMYATTAMSFLSLPKRAPRRNTERLLWCPPYGVMKSSLCEARHYRNCPTTTNGKEPLGALPWHTARQSERCEDATSYRCKTSISGRDLERTKLISTGLPEKFSRPWCRDEQSREAGSRDDKRRRAVAQRYALKPPRTSLEVSLSFWGRGSRAASRP